MQHERKEKLRIRDDGLAVEETVERMSSRIASAIELLVVVIICKYSFAALLICTSMPVILTSFQ